MPTNTISKELMQQLLKISSALSSEKDIDQLLENILQAALQITNADAGHQFQGRHGPVEAVRQAMFARHDKGLYPLARTRRKGHGVGCIPDPQHLIVP